MGKEVCLVLFVLNKTMFSSFGGMFWEVYF